MRAFALAGLITVILVACSDAPDRGIEAHFTARRADVTIDLAGPDKPETFDGFVLEAVPGWRILDGEADVHDRPGGPPLWTMHMPIPEYGTPGRVVRGIPKVSAGPGWILKRMEVRVPPVEDGNVLCTILAPASTVLRETGKAVPSRTECVPIPEA